MSLEKRSEVDERGGINKDSYTRNLNFYEEVHPSSLPNLFKIE